MKSLLLSALFLFAAVSVGHADTAKFDGQMKPVAAAYLMIQEALAGDSNVGVAAAAKTIAGLAATLDAKTVQGAHAAHYVDLPSKIEAAAKVLAEAKDLAGSRAALKTLSQPLAMWVTMSKPAGISVVFCSMAKGSWLQKTGPVKNPYYGASMLSCGEVVGGAAPAQAEHEHKGHSGHAH